MVTKRPKTDEISVLVVAEGNFHKIEIGPRTEDPGKATYLQFLPWDRVPEGSPGAGGPLCCIQLNKEWFDNYTADKTLHPWLKTFGDVLKYLENNPNYRFGCPVCGALSDTIKDYQEHIDGHRTALNNL